MPTLASLVATNAQRVPDRPAVVHDEAVLTWRTLDAEVGRCAATLAGAGVRRGDRVALVGANTTAFIVAAFGALRLGAVIVPINTRLARAELAHVLADADPALIAAEAAQADRVRLAAGDVPLLTLGPDLTAAAGTPLPVGDVEESDDAMIIYTSGTTGTPKGVLHTHHSALWAAMSQITAAGLQDGERFLHVAPLYHAGGLVFLSAITAVGGTHVLLPEFEPAATIAAVRRHGVTCMLTVPAVLALLLRVLENEADLASWRRAIVGGSAMPEATLSALFTRLPQVRLSQMCGQTESGPAGLFSTHEQMTERPSASGHQAEPFLEARVVDERGRDVTPPGVGELVFRGETVMKEYWRQPEATAATIRDGWLHTGDVVRIDTDGSYTIVDRLKDMLITGSRNVYSIEVEQAVATHPDVLECAVIGRPHELWGESIVAVVAPREGTAPTLDEVRDHCRDLIADYKLPHHLILDTLPRNPSGKVLKDQLRQRYGTPDPETSR